MLVLIRLVLAIVVLAYPFVVYYGLSYFEFWQVSLFVMFVALVRMLVLKDQASKLLKVGVFGAAVLFLFGVLALVLSQEVWLKIYPVVISLALCYVFAASLWTEKSMIQRFAEIREKDITPAKGSYMRQLTLVWCGFFVINALISFYTLWFGSTKLWMLYNGLISYILTGALVLGELLYRHLVVMKRLS